jgi:HEPN superfamily RiboL-PSP-like protein
MAMLDELETELGDQIKLIFDEFIARYLPAKPEEGPDVYHQHVKAYCILAHAAFEQFVEQVSLALMMNAVDNWYKNRTMNSSLVALLLFYKSSIVSNENEDEDQQRNFEQVRSGIDAAKRSHSRAIFDNHGFSLKYLRSILTPVAIDLSNDPSLSNSLRTLADARGSYAHTIAKLGMFVDKNKAMHPMTPEKARDVVNDCLSLCKKISEDAKKIFVNP